MKIKTGQICQISQALNYLFFFTFTISHLIECKRDKRKNINIYNSNLKYTKMQACIPFKLFFCHVLGNKVQIGIQIVRFYH